MDFGFTAIPAIAIICYLIAEGIKATSIPPKWIPTTCGAVGGILGVVAMLIMPEYPAGDYLTAIAIGIASGFSATGIYETVKKLGDKIGKK